MSDIVKRLDVKAGVMEMGEKIAWGSDTALIREAARAIEEKDKRIAELEKVAEAAAIEETPHYDVYRKQQARIAKRSALRAAGYLKEQQK